MEVLAKCRLPFQKHTTRLFVPTVLACLNDYSIDESVMHYVRSPFDYSNEASAHKLDNKIDKVDDYLNCLFVERCFNAVLRVLVYDCRLTEDDLKTLTITSAYRGLALNTLVKGSNTSLHRHGLAIDVYTLLPNVLRVITDYFVQWCNKVDGKSGHGKLFPYEVIRYSPNRIHIGFKYIVV